MSKTSPNVVVRRTIGRRIGQSITTLFKPSSCFSAKINNSLNIFTNRGMCVLPSGNFDRHTSNSVVDGLISLHPNGVGLLSNRHQINESANQHEPKKPNESLENYMREVDIVMGKFLGVTILSGISTSYALSAIDNIASVYMPITYCVCIGSMLGSIYYTKQSNKNKINSGIKNLQHAYYAHGLLGIATGPLFMVLTNFNPYAFAFAGVIFVGCKIATRNLPQGLLLVWKDSLHTSLWGLLGFGSIGVISALSGFNNFADALLITNFYANIALLTVFHSYDTQKLINDYENNNKNLVNHAMNYSYNILGIFHGMYIFNTQFMKILAMEE